MKNLKLLFNFLKGNTVTYLGAFVAICLSAVFAISVPMVIRVTIDSVIGEEPVDLPLGLNRVFEFLGDRAMLQRNLWVVFILLVLLTVGQGVFQYIKGMLAAKTSESSSKRIREKVYDHLQHLPYDYHVKSHAGDLIQRCTSDVETVQNFVSGQFVEVGQTVVSVLFVLSIMVSIDIPYTLISLLFIPVIGIATLRFFRGMMKVFKETDEAEGRMSTTLQENLTGVRVIKAFAAQKFEMDKFDQRNREYKSNVMRIVRLMANFWSSSDFLCLVQMFIVTLCGAYWTSTGRITLGTLVAFSTYSGMLIWPIRGLGQMMAFMGQAFVSLGRIQEILDHPVEDLETGEMLPIQGEIEFDNVHFAYEQGKPVLDGISFKIERGQTVAILGATGSGKSSLVHLLLRLYDYQKGCIRIDGHDIRRMDRKWLRRNIGIVLQEPFLFSRSIRDNLSMGRVNAPEAEIYKAASIASVHDTIQEFENGYDTVVGERGVTLSGGQRQRLAIARTVIRDIPVLIFDDSLSAVDMETDAAIRKALKERSKDTTTIIISHRITTLADADRILVLEDGKVKQSGTHEELIRQDGLYKRVWEIQGALEEEMAGIVH